MDSGTDLLYNTIHLHRCTGDFSGSSEDIITNGRCLINTETGLFPPSCRFTPDYASSTASLLNFEYVEDVSSYCNSNCNVAMDVM